MKIYELRLDDFDRYYSLGLFACIDDIKKACAKFDGADGRPIFDYSVDSERLEVLARTVGDACLIDDVLLCYANRDCYADDDTGKTKWRTEWHDVTTTKG
jgi:hypothetical protein